MQTAFVDPDERTRLTGMVRSLTPVIVAADAHTYVDALLALPDVAGDAVGTTGYCIGGRASLTAAGVVGDRIAAAASFHGGRLAVEDDPGSPHHNATAIRARVYLAGATDDASFGSEQADLLDRTLTNAGVTHRIETYPAAHGFAVPDVPAYDAEAADRHWTGLSDLFGRF